VLGIGDGICVGIGVGIGVGEHVVELWPHGHPRPSVSFESVHVPSAFMTESVRLNRPASTHMSSYSA
jgi:hypothetical protein